jgi:hypothetical protein
VTVRVPPRFPEAVGVNAIPTVHPTLGPRLGPQVLTVILKSAPLTLADWRFTAALLVFEMVIFWTALVELIVVEGKFNVRGVRTIAAAGDPVPVSDAVACPPATFP